MQSGGDYDHRERGLLALYRPRDLVEFDVHRAECKAGVVAWVPDHFRVPYAVLRACAEPMRSCHPSRLPRTRPISSAPRISIPAAHAGRN